MNKVIHKSTTSLTARDSVRLTVKRRTRPRIDVSAWGSRWSMPPAQARRLAQALTEAANAADQTASSNHKEPT